MADDRGAAGGGRATWRGMALLAAATAAGVALLSAPAGSDGSAAPAFVAIPGGSFLMGATDHYREETPVRRVTVGAFEITRTEITNDQFAAFVAATGYVTTAERGLDPATHPGWPPELLAPGSRAMAANSTVAVSPPNTLGGMSPTTNTVTSASAASSGTKVAVSTAGL